MNLSMESIKKQVGAKAAEFVDNGMCVGLGTGSTAAYFIQSLGKRCREGLQIQAIPSSKQTEQLAKENGIPLATHATQIDLTIDGADEIDPQKRMIKGGGGALLREKILATASKEMIVIVDESKCVDKLGQFPLPVELSPFCYEITLKQITSLGHPATLRMAQKNTPFITDNGNYIADIQWNQPPEDPEEFDAELRTIPGVIETGFFFGLAKRVIVGFKNNNISVL